MKLIVFTFMLLLSTKVRADDGENIMHISAHFGACYVITHVTEVVCTKVAGTKHKIACTIGGVLLANTINIVRKANQEFPNDTKRAVTSGAAGSLAAVIMINF